MDDMEWGDDDIEEALQQEVKVYDGDDGGTDNVRAKNNKAVNAQGPTIGVIASAKERYSRSSSGDGDDGKGDTKITERSSLLDVRRLLNDEESEETAMLAAAAEVEVKFVTKKVQIASKSINSNEPAAPTCQSCGSLSVDPLLLNVFNEPVCAKCKSELAMFKMLTKTRAKEEHLLTDDDLLYLKYHLARNPRRAMWGSMKLYLVKQLEHLSMKRWETKAKLEEEKARREKERQRRRMEKAQADMIKSKKRNTDSLIANSIKRLRGDIGDDDENETADKAKRREDNKGMNENEDDSSESDKASKTLQKSKKKDRKSKKEKKDKKNKKVLGEKEFKSYHEHVFGTEELIDKDNDLYSKSCTECGFKVQFEKL